MPRKRIVPSWPCQPHVVAELAEYVALEAARDEQLRRVLHGQPGLLAGEADAVELPLALARARRPQRGHAVGRLGAGQELAVAEVGGRREHVELEAEPQALRQAGRGQRRRQRAQRRERLDAPQGALRARALEVAAHEQERLALGRHDQVRVLRRAAEVDEIGRLHDQRRVEPVAPQPAWNAAMRRAISSAGGGGGSTDADDSDGAGATLSRVILHNGSVRTGDPRLPLARALAIAGDRIGGGVDVREGDRSQRLRASASIWTAAASCPASRTRTCTSSSGRSRSARLDLSRDALARRGAGRPRRAPRRARTAG